MGRSLEELEMMFTETETIRGIVKESRKPLTGGLGLSGVSEKMEKKEVDEDEFA